MKLHVYVSLTLRPNMLTSCPTQSLPLCFCIVRIMRLFTYEGEFSVISEDALSLESHHSGHKNVLYKQARQTLQLFTMKRNEGVQRGARGRAFLLFMG